MGRLGHIVLGGEAGGCGAKGKTEKKKRKKKRRTDHELYKKRNSLIISPLFFDAFTGELISLITRVNYERSPPPPPLTEDYLIFFFFLTASSYQVKRAELYLYDEKPSDYIVSTFLEVCAFRKATHGVFGVGALAERSGLIDCHWSV